MCSDMELHRTDSPDENPTTAEHIDAAISRPSRKDMVGNTERTIIVRLCLADSRYGTVLGGKTGAGTGREAGEGRIEKKAGEAKSSVLHPRRPVYLRLKIRVALKIARYVPRYYSSVA